MVFRIEGMASASGGAMRPIMVPEEDVTRPGAPRAMTRMWRDFMEGRYLPILHRQLADRSILIDRVDERIPGASAWLITPFWFQFENEAYDWAGLAKIVGRMPTSYQDKLTFSPCSRNEIVRFKPPCKELIAEFAVSGGPWGLGGIASAMRISELMMDSAMQRHAAIALLSVLRSWGDHFSIAEDFGEIWDVVYEKLRDPIYLTPGDSLVRAPITGDNINRYDQRILELQRTRRMEKQESQRAVDELMRKIFEQA